MSQTRFSGRTALVTGAGGGLGRTIARALASEGARVLLVGRTQQTLEETAALLPDRCARVLVADAADSEEVDQLVAATDEEHVDILINNAGVAGPTAVLTETEPDDFDDCLRANVRSVFLMSRAFVPPMVERGDGRVLSIASVAGKRPLPGRSPYCASKAAVLALTTTLAAEVGPSGVIVNTLSPGPVDSERMRLNFSREARRLSITEEDAQAAYVGRSILGRLLTEDEVAEAALSVLCMSGLHAADIDLSVGMVAR